MLPLDTFEKVETDYVDDHIVLLYAEKQVENQDLGYVNRVKDTIFVHLPKTGIELEIVQSLSQLSSKSSSTGFVAWKSSQYLADWILSDTKCPLYPFFQSRDKTLDVLELGAGVGGVCAATLGPHCRQYVCSDQRGILKLLSHNVATNCEAMGTSSESVSVIEFDWEEPEAGSRNYTEVTESGHKPDLVIACDTIYNEYLIPHFLASLKAVMGHSTVCLMTIHLRDSITHQAFVEATIAENFNLFIVPDELLSPELTKGFVVYFLSIQDTVLP